MKRQNRAAQNNNTGRCYDKTGLPKITLADEKTKQGCPK
jgi:hypothetical protein